MAQRPKTNAGSAAQARRVRESQRRRKAILAAAREVFFSKGLHHATMDDVAAQAEIAKGTVYLYFTSKEALIAGLLLEGLDLLVETLASAYDGDAPHTAEDRLRRLACGYLEFMGKNPHYFRLITSMDRGRFEESIPEDLYQQVYERSLQGLRWIIQAIDQGMQAGEFQPGDARQRAGMAWAALNGVLVLFNHPLRRALLETDLEPMYSSVLDMIIRDLRSAPKPN